MSRLHRVCPNCGRLVGLDWSLCAWCGRDFDRRDITAAVRSVPALGDVEEAILGPGVSPRAAARPAGPVSHATPTTARVDGGRLGAEPKSER